MKADNRFKVLTERETSLTPLCKVECLNVQFCSLFFASSQLSLLEFVPGPGRTKRIEAAASISNVFYLWIFALGCFWAKNDS